MPQTEIPQELQTPIESAILQNLVPHKGKMFLLSRITQYDIQNNTITAEFDVTDTCLFYDEAIQGVPSWISFELIAQAVSALTGIKNTLLHIPPRAGFLLSIMNYTSSVASFTPGTTIRIQAQQDYNADGIYKYNGQVFVAATETPEIKAGISVMETDNIEEYAK